MSTSAEPGLEPVWHGEDVTIGDVLMALDDVRAKFAREEAGDDEHVHPRNCVMTLVGVAPTEEDERVAERTSRIIGTEHPAQAIVIREQAPLRGHHLDASISTEVRRPEMSCATEGEIITLHVRGKAANHLGALVDPLLVSGVPTYLWWLGTPPFSKRELMDALRVCDGLVVDSSRFDEPFHSFRGLARVLKVAHHRLGLGDFQWSRLRPWRETIAQFFMPRDRRVFLGGISGVGIDYAGEGRGNRIAAALMTGWMASALGWRLRLATAGSGGVVVAHYETGSRIVEVVFRSTPRDHLAPGELSAIRIEGNGRGTTFGISVQRDPARPRHTERESDDFPYERRGSDTAQVLLTMIEIGETEPLRHIQQLEPADEVALLLDLLSTGTHDEVFNRSLASAIELMEKF